MSLWMQRVERERAVCGRQLLDCGQWRECVVHSVSCRRVLLVGLQLVERERVVRCGQFLNIGQWYQFVMQCMSCWGVLPCGLQLDKWERAVRARQLLYSWKRNIAFMQRMPRGHVQCERRVHFCCSLFCMPCWRVLLGRMQLVERERVVRCGQLLDCRQWYKRNLHALSRRTILPFWLQQQRGQRSV